MPNAASCLLFISHPSSLASSPEPSKSISISGSSTLTHPPCSITKTPTSIPLSDSARSRAHACPSSCLNGCSCTESSGAHVISSLPYSGQRDSSMSSKRSLDPYISPPKDKYFSFGRTQGTVFWECSPRRKASLRKTSQKISSSVRLSRMLSMLINSWSCSRTLVSSSRVSEEAHFRRKECTAGMWKDPRKEYSRQRYWRPEVDRCSRRFMSDEVSVKEVRFGSAIGCPVI
ncbi:hypothetical protein B0H19DRAFT_1179696 [Mycena capillaripes]|nr:hypothetical protein B0H19DRAFT_1179696 [Mycena capillaripes]